MKVGNFNPTTAEDIHNREEEYRQQKARPPKPKPQPAPLPASEIFPVTTKWERVGIRGEMLRKDEKGHFIERWCLCKKCNTAILRASPYYVCFNHWRRTPDVIKNKRYLTRIAALEDYWKTRT